jgi:glycosyltransferase involved in cell wall biosynthesis
MRNYGLIAGLAKRHRVHLVSFLAPHDEPSRATPLGDLCETLDAVPQPTRSLKQRLWDLATCPLPDMAHRLCSPAFAETLSAVLARYEFDVVEFEGIEMMPYLSTVLEGSAWTGSSPHLVFDDHNAEYLLQQRVFEADIRTPRRWAGALYSLMQWAKLERYEAWAMRQVDHVVAVSSPDAEALHRIAPGARVSVVPNGIDVVTHAQKQSVRDFLPTNSLVFTGKMDFRPNVDAALWFAQHVLPLIRQRIPSARFYIVGQRPHARLDVLRDQPGVVITGRVEETRPYIAAAALYVIPLRSGGGTRFKVLEAMAIGCPIVSTRMGCDGFPITPDLQVALADEPQGFAETVIELMKDQSRRQKLVAAASEFVQAYDWSRLVPRLERVYASEG